MSTLVPFTLAQAQILSESRTTHDQNTRKLSACESDFIRQGLTRWTSKDQRKRDNAESILVAYWNMEAENDREANIRALFSRIAKTDFPEVFDGAGVVVEDDKLKLAKTRKSKKSPLQKLADQCNKMHKSGKFTLEQEKMLAKMFAETVQSAGL